MVTWSVICFTLPNYLQIIFHSLHITHLLAAGKRESLLVDPPQVHASSHRTVFIVAHHCSTISHPRTDRTALTHPQTDRTIVPMHPLTTTIVTKSNNLYLDRAFRSHLWSCCHCLSLSQAHCHCFSLSQISPAPLPFSFSLLLP